MSDLDAFAEVLLEEAKRFLGKSREEKNPQGKAAFLHAALSVGFCALEAHISAISEDFLARHELTPAEVGILREREVILQEGEFVVSDRLKMQRIEERIEFLHRRFSGKPLNRQAQWWGELKAGLGLRNELIHPKASPAINDQAVERALQAVIETVSTLYKAIYKRPLPSKNVGLESRLDF